MFKKGVNLDNVSIATPCPVKWENMEGDETIRFCNLCELNVYNISNLKRKEAETLLANQSGRICLKLYRRSDGTLITKDCPIGRRITDAFKAKVSVIAASITSLVSFIPAFAQSQSDSSAQRLKQEIVQQAKNNSLESLRKRVGPPQPPAAFSTLGVGDRFAGFDRITLAAKEEQVASMIKLDTTTNDAFVAAQNYQFRGELGKAKSFYEIALDTFRKPGANYDPRFAETIAQAYSRLLLKQNNKKAARAIEREFCKKNYQTGS